MKVNHGIITESTVVREIPIQRGYEPPKKRHKKGVIVNDSVAQMVESLIQLKVGETFIFYPASVDRDIRDFYEYLRGAYKKRTGNYLVNIGIRLFISRSRDCVIALKV